MDKENNCYVKYFKEMDPDFIDFNKSDKISLREKGELKKTDKSK